MVAGMNTRLLPAASVMGVKDGAGSMKYRLTHKCPTPSGLAVQRMSSVSYTHLTLPTIA